MRWLFYPPVARSGVTMTIQTVNARTRMHGCRPLRHELWRVGALLRCVVLANRQVALALRMLLVIASGKVALQVHRSRRHVRLVGVLHEKIFVEGTVIVEIMATG
jgi:hypothetical protein